MPRLVDIIQMTPFINIHAHKSRGNWSILNVDQRDFNLPKHPFSLGLHPWFVTEDNFDKNLDFLKKNLGKTLAVGECGLDKVCNTNWQLQRKAFMAQIQLSEKHQLPLIIHCVRAYNEIIAFKKEFRPKMPWIVHGFNKKQSILEGLLNNGFYISLGKKLIHNKQWILDISDILPLNRLFFETDDSEISIEDVYLSFSKNTGVKMDILKAQIFENYKKIFGGK